MMGSFPTMKLIPLWIGLSVLFGQVPGIVLAEEDGEKEPPIYQPHCRLDLGMQTGNIQDHHISASSAYDGPSVGPQNARIRTEKNGGAWCPKVQISHNKYEWLEINLNGLKMVTLVETQGRFGNGQGQEFVEEYMLEYQRTEGGRWLRYKNRMGNELFRGNWNTYIAELREVNPPIIARTLRFVPYSRHPRTVCMRVEVYGCPWNDGLISYTIPQGHRRGSEVNLYDYTYDGVLRDGMLKGGLGQLTDTEEGITNFRLDQSGTGKKGYEWVGWKNDTANGPPVELIFEFDAVRNFSSVRFHCNNLFSKGIRVFSRAELFFSVGGHFYTEDPVIFTYMKDTLIEYARPVIIPIPYRIGRFVKIHLYFESRWVLISEVKFDSVIAEGTFIAEFPPSSTVPNTIIQTPIPTTPVMPSTTTTQTTTQSTTTPAKSTTVAKSTTAKKAGSSSSTTSKEVAVVQVKSNIAPETTPSVKMADNHGYAIDGAEKHRGESNENDVTLEMPTGSTSGSENLPESQDEAGLKEEHIGIIIGALAALILLLFSIAVFILIRQQKKKNNHDKYYEKYMMGGLNSAHEIDSDYKLPGSNGLLQNYNMYNAISSSDREYEDDSIRKLKLQAAAGATPDNNLNKCQAAEGAQGSPQEDEEPHSPLYVKLPPDPVFQTPPQLKPPTPLPRQHSPTPPSSTSRPSPSPPSVPPPPIPPPPHPSALLRAYDFLPFRPDLNGNGSSDTISNKSLGKRCSNGKINNILEFPRENIKFVEKIGDGQFGEVHQCEAAVGAISPSGRPTVNPVVVKLLSKDADIVARDQFHREAHILAALKDPNVAQVIGICTESEPHCMILEYTHHGDLNSFLRQHILEEPGMERDPRAVSYGSLIYVGTQIASGMKYLESRNMVHRDLATRNCLIGSNYAIKISDIGMCWSSYAKDYYRLEGRTMLPIRWMAWESVMLGKFSRKSDVWAFGVTLWEILMLSRDRVFSQLTDEQVIQNCSHFFKQDGCETYLPPPESCPREIYDLMRECWNREESQRPAFREIHMFLQRKNMGYDPEEEWMLKGYADGSASMV